MLRTAARERRLHNVATVEGWGEAVPLPSGSQDAVASSFAAPFMECERMVGEMARVVVPGGRVAVQCVALVDDSPGFGALVRTAAARLSHTAGVAGAELRLGAEDELRAAFAHHDLDDVRVQRAVMEMSLEAASDVVPFIQWFLPGPELFWWDQPHSIQRRERASFKSRVVETLGAMSADHSVGEAAILMMTGVRKRPSVRVCPARRYEFVPGLAVDLDTGHLDLEDRNLGTRPATGFFAHYLAHHRP